MINGCQFWINVDSTLIQRWTKCCAYWVSPARIPPWWMWLWLIAVTPGQVESDLVVISRIVNVSVCCRPYLKTDWENLLWLIILLIGLSHKRPESWPYKITQDWNFRYLIKSCISGTHVIWSNNPGGPFPNKQCWVTRTRCGTQNRPKTASNTWPHPNKRHLLYGAFQMFKFSETNKY